MIPATIYKPLIIPFIHGFKAYKLLLPPKYPATIANGASYASRGVFLSYRGSFPDKIKRQAGN